MNSPYLREKFQLSLAQICAHAHGSKMPAPCPQHNRRVGFYDVCAAANAQLRGLHEQTVVSGFPVHCDFPFQQKGALIWIDPAAYRVYVPVSLLLVMNTQARLNQSRSVFPCPTNRTV